jgi:hypothetical protein
MRAALGSVVAWLVLLAGCSSSTTNESTGIGVGFTNSNRAPVVLYDCPRSLCEGVAKLPGCGRKACLPPSGGKASGQFFGWRETRDLPFHYRLSLRGRPLHCPPAVGPPPDWPNPEDYRVNYDITPSGRCIIVSHGPLT